MNSALIGHTGFVGGNLSKQFPFDQLYNSKNIQEIQNKSFAHVVCAAAPGKKWWANLHPDEDLKSIQTLIEHLQTVKTDHFVLISTVDVYRNPTKVDEDTRIDSDQLSPYGKNRFLLEEFVRKKFPVHTIIRLPALFGPSLKKNFIFDLIHDKNLELTNPQSIFQFYNLEHLWNDLQRVQNHSISLMNFATEPIAAQEVYEYVFEKKIPFQSTATILSYDMRTIHSSLFDRTGSYLYRKKEILDELKQFILKERRRNTT